MSALIGQRCACVSLSFSLSVRVYVGVGVGVGMGVGEVDPPAGTGLDSESLDQRLRQCEKDGILTFGQTNLE